MIKNLHEGMKLTVINIDGMMAMSHRKEILVKSICEPLRTGYQKDKLRIGTMTQRGKRKEFYLDVERGMLFFEGWDLPLKVDTDKTQSELSMTGFNCSTMRGNACYNFVGDKKVIKDYLLNKQINDEVQDEHLAKCLIINGNDHDGELLFPEIETGHAVINQIKNKTAA